MKIFDFIIKDNVSPNGHYYYKLKPAVSLNPSAFGSEVAFFDTNDMLLYHNKSAFAHELNDPEDVAVVRAMAKGIMPERDLPMKKDPYIRVATWSKQGNWVYILEYFKFEATYYNVFLNLKEQYQIRAIHTISRKQEYISIPAQIITKLRLCYPNFDEVEVLNTLEELGLRKEEPMLKDPVEDNFFANLLPKNRWYK